MTVSDNSKIKRKRPLWKAILTWCIISVLVGLISLVIFMSISTSVTENVDSYVYNLPFEQGTAHRIIQGYGGLFSHENVAALDFDMAEGTPIVQPAKELFTATKTTATKADLLRDTKAKPTTL